MNTITLSTIVVILVVLICFILPLRLSWRSRGFMAFVVLLASSKSYLYLLVGGDAYDPAIPYNLTFIFDIARTTLIFLAILALIRLIINICAKLLHRDIKAEALPSFSLFHAQLMLLVSFALACYGTACAYGTPEVKNYSITMNRLDPRLDGMKVVMLSDLHISSPTNVNVIYDLVQRVNDMNPDLILMPGDLMDGSVAMRRPITNLLFDLKAKFGVYISSGNHEYYSGYQQWRDYFEQGGLVSLDNKVLVLKDAVGKTLLNLGGLTDERAALYHMPEPDVKGVLTALDDKAPSIILAHRPRLAKALAAAQPQVKPQPKNGQSATAAGAAAATNADAAGADASAGKDTGPDDAKDVGAGSGFDPAQVAAANLPERTVDLVLSGHTHGGLVTGLSRVVAKANDGFVSGHYKLGRTSLIVGNGTMVWMGFPLRIGVPGQIVVVTLKAAKGSPSVPLELKLTAAADKVRSVIAVDKQKQEESHKLALHRSEAASAAAATTTNAVNTDQAAPGSQPGQLVLTGTVRNVSQAAPATALAPATAATPAQNNEPGAHGYSLGLISKDAATKSTADTAKSARLPQVQLILPMVDPESGQISEQVTSVALLPDNLTQDQINRINAIIHEKVLTAEEKARLLQEQQKEEQAAALRRSNSPEILNTPTSGVTIVMVKNSTTKAAAPQNAAAAATTAAASASANASSDSRTGVMQLPASTKAAAPAAALAPDAGTGKAPGDTPNQKSSARSTTKDKAASDNTVSSPDTKVAAVNSAPVSEEDADTRTASFDDMSMGYISDQELSTTMELQAEYAISFSNSQNNAADHTISDMLKKKSADQGASAAPSAPVAPTVPADTPAAAPAPATKTASTADAPARAVDNAAKASRHTGSGNITISTANTAAPAAAATATPQAQ